MMGETVIVWTIHTTGGLKTTIRHISVTNNNTHLTTSTAAAAELLIITTTTAKDNIIIEPDSLFNGHFLAGIQFDGQNDRSVSPIADPSQNSIPVHPFLGVRRTTTGSVYFQLFERLKLFLHCTSVQTNNTGRFISSRHAN
jgi:hypothetical protein